MRFLVVTGVTGIIFFILSVTIPYLYVHPFQQCAPSTPPSVPGTPIPPAATPGAFYINEVLLVSDGTWNCSPQGTGSQTNNPWVEFYNPHDYPLDVYAVHASLYVGADTTYPFYLPFGSAIAPHGFLVVFPDLTMFTSTNQQTTIRLIIAGVTIDQVTVPPLMRNQSYARVSDGGTSWQVIDNPTIAASNTPAISLHKTPTPTRSPTPSPPGGNKSKRKGGSSVDHTDQPELINGTQPAWQQLHFPINTPKLLEEARPPASTMTAQTAITTDDGVPHRILLTLIATAMALVLFWCWRLFRS